MKYVHEPGCKHGTDGEFLLSVHLQMCNANHWEQKDSNVADEVDNPRDVAGGRIVALAGKERFPSLRRE